MSDMLLGLKLENWRLAYYLWLDDNNLNFKGVEPKSLFELKSYWEGIKPQTPYEVMEMGSLLINIGDKYRDKDEVIYNMIDKLNNFRDRK